MRSKIKRSIIVATAIVLLLGAFILGYRECVNEEDFYRQIEFQYQIGDEVVSTRLWWDNTDEIYYLFVPSFCDVQQMSFSVVYPDRWMHLQVNGEEVLSGEAFDATGAEYFITSCPVLFSEEHATYPMTFLYGSNLASVFIEDDGIDMLKEKVLEDFSLKETRITVFDQNGTLDYQNNLEKIKLHGNLTKQLDKKPYNLYLKKSDSLLGMAAGRKWVLLANATDGTLLRNKAMLDFANACALEEQYEPSGEFVELYMNGEYQGVYLLAEAIEASPERFDISLDDTWFLEKTLVERTEENANFVGTNHHDYYEVKNSPKLSEVEQEQILQVLEELESALYSENGMSQNGYQLEELIDLESFAFNFLMREISADHDTGLSSDYMYFKKDEHSKIYAGPVWDFDGIWGNANKQQYRIPNALLTSVTYALPAHNLNQNRLYGALYRHEAFQKEVKRLYQEKISLKLHDLYEDQLEQYRLLLKEHATRDSLRWNENQYLWFFNYPANYHLPETGDYHRFNQFDSHMEMVDGFLREKMEFLDALFIEEKPFCVVVVENEAPYLNKDWPQTRYYWIEKGDCIGNLSWTNQDGYYFDTFAIKGTDTIVTEDMQVLEDMIIETIWE